MSVKEKRVLSHVDMRVKNRVAAIAYYDRLLGEFGMRGSYGDEWCEYSYKGAAESPDWIAFTEDPGAEPGPMRVSFAAPSRAEVDRIAALLASFGSRAIEGPEFAYGPHYYAVFFEDPDGNKLEICYIGD
jgi:catechol 2,3-dioxygenase-like lactoylglutathione lyase family enzyme